MYLQFILTIHIILGFGLPYTRRLLKLPCAKIKKLMCSLDYELRLAEVGIEVQEAPKSLNSIIVIFEKLLMEDKLWLDLITLNSLSHIHF